MSKTVQNKTTNETALEKRLSLVESQLAQLSVLVEERLPPHRDWRKAIGIFTGDNGMQEFFEDAMKIREADRAKARNVSRKRAKS